MFDTIFVTPLFNLLAAIYAVIPGHDFGVAIILLVVVVRLLLWPLMAKQFHSQRALQALSPEVAKVKAKAKGDKQLEGKLLMELYKERGISPFGALKPTLVQGVLLLALFFVIREIIKPGQLDIRLYEPVRNLSYLKQILASGGELKASFLGLVDLTKANPFLAILTGLTQFYQTKQITPKHGNDSQAKTMQMMNYVLPLVFVVFTLSLPAALPLFWTAGSLAAILQQHILLRQDVADLENPKTQTNEAKA
jgi:YidC/Oxa1 family membrane protein insertase